MKKEIIIMYAVGAIIVLIILNKVGKGFKNIGEKGRERREEKTEAEKVLSTTDYFNPLYYKSVAHAQLGEGVALDFAKRLRRAMWLVGRTNVSQIKGVFANLKNKVNISEVAEAYYNKYKKDLRSAIMGELTKGQTVDLMIIIDALPNH